MASELTGQTLTINGGSINNHHELSGMALLDISNDQISSCNQLEYAGIYQGQDLNDAPTNGWVTYITIPHGTMGTGGNRAYARQLAFPIATNKIYSRYRLTYEWSNWVELHS